MGFSLAILDAYNWKMKQGLPQSKLYQTPIKEFQSQSQPDRDWEQSLYSMDIDQIPQTP